MVVLFLLMGNSFFAFGQLNTLGRDFYVGFLENGRSLDTVNVQSEKAVVILTANEKTSGTIETPKQKISFSLEKGQQLIKEFDAIREGLIHEASGFVFPKHLRIISTGKIAVHALNGRAYSTGSTVVLPVDALGLDYMVMAHHERALVTGSPLNHTTLESALMIVGTANDTQVEITPSVRTTSGNPNDIPFKIVLDAGESYQIKSNEDLTGTKIRVLNDNNTNCKKVAVFAGNRMSSAGLCGTTGDHLFQQAYPTNTWGKSYIHVPLKDRTSGEFVKVLALEDGTDLRVNGQLRTRLNSGKYIRLEFGKNEVASIETSKPSSVAVLSKSGFCNEFFAASLGDPNFFSYSPNKQRIAEIQFSTGRLYGRFNLSITHFLNVIVPKGAANKTLLNGQNIGGQFKPVPGTEFVYAQIQIPEGVNQLKNPEGVIGYVYGSGQIESYGFAIGTGIDNIQYEADSKYAFEVEGEKVACLGEEGTWKILPEDTSFTEFTWSFGDATAVVDGQEVVHTFAKPGKYLVSVFATTGSGKCDEQETFRFEVDVKAIEAQLTGPTSVCPLIDEFTYTLEDTLQVKRVEWKISGGTILEESLTSVKVNWGAPNPNAKLTAVPFNAEGCPGETLELNIAVTETIEPRLPEGDSGICGAGNALRYKVPFLTAGRVYMWRVTGGTVISGKNSPEVDVLWNLNAPVKTIFYEESSTVNGACTGVSDLLEVKIYPEFKINPSDLIKPACPGERNGSIRVNPTGGSGSYEFQWAHDRSLKTAFAEGLGSGTYEVTISDASGCAVESLKFELTEPDELRVTEPVISLPNSCFGLEDGEFVLMPSGGNPPFTVVGFESVWDGKELKILGISPGSYRLQVLDSRGCSTEVPATMEGPEELSVLAKVGNPGCEGSLDGELELEIAGGIGPYQVQWANGQTGARISELPYGEFAYTIRDSKGCVLTGVAVVNQARPEVRMPTGFDPEDGVFQPVSNCSISYQLSIYDRWGGIIYFGSEGWNGLIRGVEAPANSYSFLIRYSYILEGKEASSEKKGAFTLIR